MKIFLSFLLLLLSAIAAAALEARISDLEVVVDGNRALVSFRLEEGFDQRLVERVESGLPTELVYRLEVIRKRRRWFDKKVAGNTLRVIAMYDAVKGEYLVNYKLAGKLIRSRIVRDLEELEQAMTRFEREPVFSLEEVPASWRLRARVRAELGSKTILLLIPSKITTNWSESERFHSLNTAR